MPVSAVSPFRMAACQVSPLADERCAAVLGREAECPSCAIGPRQRSEKATGLGQTTVQPRATRYELPCKLLDRWQL